MAIVMFIQWTTTYIYRINSHLLRVNLSDSINTDVTFHSTNNDTFRICLFYRTVLSTNGFIYFPSAHLLFPLSGEGESLCGSMLCRLSAVFYFSLSVCMSCCMSVVSVWPSQLTLCVYLYLVIGRYMYQAVILRADAVHQNMCYSNCSW